MKTSIEKSTSGTIRFLYGEDETPVVFANPVNVEVKAVLVPIGRPVVKTPAIQFSFQDGRGSQTVIFSDLVNINGAPKPADIQDAVIMLSNDVFNSGGGDGGGVTSNDITDATTVGKAVLTATDAAAARAAIGAGTSNLVIGTTGTTAKAGNYVPTYAEITGKPATFAPTIGTTSTTAKAGNYTPTAAEIFTALQAVPGYSAADTQSLKHISGVLTWVTDTP